MEVRTRFAPSPTGYMHIGNLRTALYAYLIAKKGHGKFILRIEDTDQERFVEGATDIIYNTLAETGLKYDEGPDIGGEYGPYVQSERRDIYRKYAMQLIEKGAAYYCFCTKERLDRLRSRREQEGLPFKYDKRCLKLTKEEIQKNLDDGIPYVIRQNVPKWGTTTFEDSVYGRITVDNSTLDDSILIKSDGLPTYNFANVVDDHLMKITHVVRGSEYLSSTPKYNLLYEAFGWEIPTYIHLPPVMKTANKKLSKRDGDASFEDFVNKGYMTQTILNYIALLGWNPGTTQEMFSLKELEEAFDIKGLNKSPAIFDEAKLKWLNGEYIRKLPLEEFNGYASEYYKKCLPEERFDYMKISALLHDRTEVFNQIPELVDFFCKLPEYDISLYTHKKMKTTPEIALDSLKNALSALEALKDWNKESLHDTLMGLVTTMGLKNGQVLWPVRVALSGKSFTPGGAIEISDILGKEETLSRIKIGIEKLA